MVKKVEEVWAAHDGKLFMTELEAHQHEAISGLSTVLVTIGTYKTGTFLSSSGTYSLSWKALNEEADMVAGKIVRQLNAYGYKLVRMTQEDYDARNKARGCTA